VTICLVTDRHRLASGAAGEAAARCLLAQIRHAASAGIDLVQIRERDLDGGALCEIVRAAVAAVRGTPTRIVVNDRLDVAIAGAAHGVHLRADSVGVAIARQLAPPSFLIGRSVHRAADLASASGADYLIAGTVFPSASKPESQPLLGVDGLREIAASAAAPILAIGGVTLERLAEVAAAGASGVAAIGLFMRERGGASGACRACALEDLTARARARFDSVISRS
jgi:thiamine-phosphate diphosphorylase